MRGAGQNGAWSLLLSLLLSWPAPLPPALLLLVELARRVAHGAAARNRGAGGSAAQHQLVLLVVAHSGLWLRP